MMCLCMYIYGVWYVVTFVYLHIFISECLYACIYPTNYPPCTTMHTAVRLLLQKGYPTEVHWAISTVMFGGQRDIFDFHLVCVYMCVYWDVCVVCVCIYVCACIYLYSVLCVLHLHIFFSIPVLIHTLIHIFIHTQPLHLYIEWI